MKKPTRSKKVLIALSGGVDSSVAASLLKDRGYNVFGITMKMFSENDSTSKSSNISDAEVVAQKLGIPFEIIDVSQIFKSFIVANFINEYLSGKTPNPCVICNNLVKFSILAQKAKEYGADFIATGHYAKIEKIKNRCILKKALDKTKDQSYFLYSLPKDMLEKIIFPLSDIKKIDVRKIAKSLGLHVAEKDDSQEICFIKDESYGAFVSKNATSIKPGPILTLDGEQIGIHKGIIYYTIGQRKGIGIPFSKPFYVVKIDAEKNALYVGEEKDVYGKKLVAENFNWISIDPPKTAMKAKAKIRYSGDETNAKVVLLKDNKVALTFEKPVKAITPGQSVVLYKNNTVLGGGIICKTN